MTPAADSSPSTTPRPGDHLRGEANATHVLVEYGDFQCPTCRQAAPVVELLLKRYGAKLLFVFRHFPLESIHPDALAAAEAAEAAAAQGRFWEMHEALFEHQQQLAPADLRHYADVIGLDPGRFDSETRAHTHLPHVRADIALGEAAHVRGTPGFFLDGKLVDVSFGMRSLHDAVEAALNS